MPQKIQLLFVNRIVVSHRWNCSTYPIDDAIRLVVENIRFDNMGLDHGLILHGLITFGAKSFLESILDEELLRGTQRKDGANGEWKKTNARRAVEIGRSPASGPAPPCIRRAHVFLAGLP
jgi:hypothetical protein